jgi:OOP family OmpA-OmpF porin
MQTKNTLLTLATAACVCGLMLPVHAQAQRRGQAATMAEERAEIAREEAALAREAVALEEKKAALAERRAALARREAGGTPAGRPRAAQLEQELADLQARETDRGLTLTLGDVVFESDRAELKADSMRKLYPLVTLLKEYPERQVLIEGHTDSSGETSYNRELSEQRAAAVRDFLVTNGTDPERISARGYGEAYPVASNDNAAGRQENRRVEVVVLHEGERAAGGRR